MASIEQTKSKIRSFQFLPKGWHYGEGDSIGYDMRERAIDFLRLAERYDIKNVDAFPSPDGQIGLSFYISQRTLAITLELDGTYNVIEDIKNKIIFDAYEISETEAKFKLWEFSLTMQILSASSTLDIMNLSAADFIILYSSAVQNKKTQNKEYPSFPSNVLEIDIDCFANTSSTIPQMS